MVWIMSQEIIVFFLERPSTLLSPPQQAAGFLSGQFIRLRNLFELAKKLGAENRWRLAPNPKSLHGAGQAKMRQPSSGRRLLRDGRVPAARAACGWVRAARPAHARGLLRASGAAQCPLPSPPPPPLRPDRPLRLPTSTARRRPRAGRGGRRARPRLWLVRGRPLPPGALGPRLLEGNFSPPESRVNWVPGKHSRGPPRPPARRLPLKTRGKQWLARMCGEVPNRGTLR